MKFSIQSHSHQQTQQIAAYLAKFLKPPVTLALEGDLGAGKTCFVAGLVQALDPNLTARSPTYALAHTYQTFPVMHHVDLYRVLDQDLEDLGIENLLDDPEAIVCIEWPEHAQNPLPAGTIQIDFKILAADFREIKFIFSDTFSRDWVLTLRENLLSLRANAG